MSSHMPEAKEEDHVSRDIWFWQSRWHFLNFCRYIQHLRIQGPASFSHFSLTTVTLFYQHPLSVMAPHQSIFILPVLFSGLQSGLFLPFRHILRFSYMFFFFLPSPLFVVNDFSLSVSWYIWSWYTVCVIYFFVWILVCLHQSVRDLEKVKENPERQKERKRECITKCI